MVRKWSAHVRRAALIQTQWAAHTPMLLGASCEATGDSLEWYATLAYDPCLPRQVPAARRLEYGRDQHGRSAAEPNADKCSVELFVLCHVTVQSA